MIKIIFLFLTAYSQDFNCKDFKNFPVLMKGCHGDSCGQLSYSKAIKDVDLYLYASLKSKKVGTIKKCEVLQGFEPITVFLGLGKGKVASVVVEDAEKGLKVGDQVNLVFNLGDGNYKACFKDQIIEVVSSDQNDASLSNIDVKQKISSGNWLKLKTIEGDTGYARNSPFYMGSFDFDIDKVCSEDHPLGNNPNEIKRKTELKLSEAFEKLCPKYLKCLLNKTADQVCNINKEFSEFLGKATIGNLKCENFVLSEEICISKWNGGFHCPTNLKQGTQNFPINFDCEKSTKISCKIN